MSKYSTNDLEYGIFNIANVLQKQPQFMHGTLISSNTNAVGRHIRRINFIIHVYQTNIAIRI